jgi:hypothetical protein
MSIAATRNKKTFESWTHSDHVNPSHGFSSTNLVLSNRQSSFSLCIEHDGHKIMSTQNRPQFHKGCCSLCKRLCHVPENCTIPLYPNAATLFLLDKVGVHKWYIHKWFVPLQLTTSCPSSKELFKIWALEGGPMNKIENHMSSLVLLQLSTCEEEVVVTLHKFSKLLIP